MSAAIKANAWSAQNGHVRAQIIYFLAENLALRESEWIKRLQELCGINKKEAKTEFNISLSRLFSYAAWSDKYDGAVHNAPYHGVTMALPEAVSYTHLTLPTICSV